ncbi:MATE family efflux transporter [Anaerotignum sp.]|uniref:MATE family efflux transporter n=1 Tax=Anaerotignum sp. TaxID=2039241 RepID=UPI0028B03E59|nr:MATE family efflux transporter [Anaerotignum sp.]
MMNYTVYEEKTIKELVFIFGIPSILALLIEMLTGVTDTIFAGNLMNIGPESLSAMALLSPLLNSFTALQTLFAMSCGILVAKYMRDTIKQRQCVQIGLGMALLTSTIASAFCGVWIKPLLHLLGAEGMVLTLAERYLYIQLFSNIISSAGYTLTCCIRAIGYPKMEVAIVVGGVGLNIFCNWLFSFYWRLSVEGLALGTAVSEVFCFSVACVYLAKKGVLARFEKVSLSKAWLLTKGMFKIGVAQTVIQFLVGATGFFVNARLLSLGDITWLGAWNVSQRIYLLMLMPIVGLTQGVQTVIAYYCGANEEAKVKQASNLTQYYCGVFGFVCLGIVIFGGEKILHLFGDNIEILCRAKMIIKIIFLGFPFVGVFYTNLTLLQVTGREMQSVSLALARQIFLLIPLLLILPKVFFCFQIPMVQGLFWATPISDFLIVVISQKIKGKQALD